MSFRAVQAMLLVAVLALVVGVRLGGQSAGNSGALPPATIPTFSTENLGRMAHFYVGGKYVGEPGKEQMSGAMYVEVWVPKQVRRPYPIVMFHGNGQSGAVFQQTPDGRPGWAHYLMNQGYVVYMVDYPARGRSPYVPGHDGELGIRSATQLSQIWTAPATSGHKRVTSARFGFITSRLNAAGTSSIARLPLWADRLGYPPKEGDPAQGSRRNGNLPGNLQRRCRALP